jgi:hypothetical protein
MWRKKKEKNSIPSLRAKFTGRGKFHSMEKWPILSLSPQISCRLSVPYSVCGLERKGKNPGNFRGTNIFYSQNVRRHEKGMGGDSGRAKINPKAFVTICAY